MKGEILADNEAAVEELFALATEERLGKPRLRINNQGFDAVVEDMTEDDILVAGGKAESGGFSAVLRASDLGRGKPKKGDDIEARGLKLQIQTVSRGIAIVTVTALDPAANE